MQRALYEPGLGYYSGGSVKLGAGGDFTTAAELGSLFPRALARCLQPVLSACAAPTVLELGAGSGRLTAGLIDALLALGLERFRYLILEPSAELRERQQALLATHAPRVSWLEWLPPEPIEGVILGNEVADALPVVRFRKRGGRARPLGVGIDGERFVWREGDEDAALSAAVGALEQKLERPLPEGFESEISLLLKPWIASLADALAAGGLLLADYGLARRDYYLAERNAGTLVCHYRHRVLDDPFLWPGLQDITAWVDFSACADAGRAAGLALSAYTTQGQFLLDTLAHDAGLADQPLAPDEAAALKTLVLPGEMGEKFKLIWLTRGDAGHGLPGRDFRSWL